MKLPFILPDLCYDYVWEMSRWVVGRASLQLDLVRTLVELPSKFQKIWSEAIYVPALVTFGRNRHGSELHKMFAVFCTPLNKADSRKSRAYNLVQRSPGTNWRKYHFVRGHTNFVHGIHVHNSYKYRFDKVRQYGETSFASLTRPIKRM